MSNKASLSYAHTFRKFPLTSLDVDYSVEDIQQGRVPDKILQALTLDTIDEYFNSRRIFPKSYVPVQAWDFPNLNLIFFNYIYYHLVHFYFLFLLAMFDLVIFNLVIFEAFFYSMQYFYLRKYRYHYKGFFYNVLFY